MMKFKNFTHGYVEARMHARGGEVVHISVVAPDYIEVDNDDTSYKYIGKVLSVCL